MEKEKVYKLHVTEKELKNIPFRNALVNVVALRLKLQKNKPHYTISSVEYEILRKHYSWVNVGRYAPKKKDQLKGEIGKYLGRRCVVRGMK